MHSSFPYKKVHLVGIKGAGMASLALILQAHNVRVTGSDTKEVFFTDAILRKAGIHFFERFSRDNIPADAEAVLFSTAYNKEHNEELQYAYEKNMPVYSYPEALGLLIDQKLSIAVCGTHGKTTTTAMLGHVLLCAKKDPSVLVGSSVLNWKSGALTGTGAHFVFEADEYQDKFSLYHPWSAIITNVGFDHADFFKNTTQYEEAFSRFIKKIPPHGWVIACADDAGALRVSESAITRRITYGYQQDALYQIHDEAPQKRFAQTFRIEKRGEVLGSISLRVSGRHNARNAASVVAFCDTLDIPFETIASGLAEFLGTSRRMEKIGTYNEALIMDDYAHHPDEIIATLQALTLEYPHKQRVVIFQPHTFSRTKEFLDEFAQVLAKHADDVILLPIYTSAREQTGEVSSQGIVDRINKISPEKASLIPTQEKVVRILKKSADKDMLIITMGAGDVWQIGKTLTQKESV
jgi:UDP-N-acetylmuramate--alanine ligase